jgi:hypothetical protein
MKIHYPKEWFERSAEIEGSAEIGAGCPAVPCSPPIDAMVNAFLSWPLPASVCADPCATMQGYPHRRGTNLLAAVEARQMFEHVIATLANADMEARGK